MGCPHGTEAYYSSAAAESGGARRTVLLRLWDTIRGLFGARPNSRALSDNGIDEWVMVCRPSVGHRVVGGGFVGVWRRKKESEVRPEDVDGGENVEDGKDGKEDDEDGKQTLKRRDHGSSR